ncbi:helix-turn-helix domain-containing protein [Halomarina salina]|uniref:Helix-turn-helix domain-containing protein n=1 Tax=Halomarina salina TaxID=1872699 RepID=A0ABD5RHJ5_9EURY|nr:helix-turn-helix domain-containing protein [Halomarina salina]
MVPASAEQSVGRDGDSSQQSGVVVRLTVPCEGFALAETLDAVPDAQFGAGSVAGTGGGVLPLLWARTSDHDRLGTALAEDSTTTRVSRLTERGDEWLYEIQWEKTVEIVVGLLTVDGGTILDASTDGGEWQLRVLYPSQSALQRAKSSCEQHDVSPEVESIRQLGGESSDEHGLTEVQHRSLRVACEAGYFDIPRDTDLCAIADQLGVSHQALSERLRRGTKKIVEQSLFTNRCGEQRRL